MIVVTGATGNVGRALVTQLAAEGHPVRALTRSPERAGLPSGVEVVQADFAAPADRAELTRLFTGATRLFLHFGAVGAATGDALAAAAQAGVTRVVMLSSGAVTGDEDADSKNAIAELHRVPERAVRASGMEWTLLRPNAFAANARQYAPQIRGGDVVRGPYADAAMAPIHEWDMAAVAARALLEDGHHGAAYRLTGPAPVTIAEQVRLIGDALGRSLRFVEIPVETVTPELFPHVPPEYLHLMLDAFAGLVGTEPEVTTTVEAVTGVPARTFADWAADHADDFR